MDWGVQGCIKFFCGSRSGGLGTLAVPEASGGGGASAITAAEDKRSLLTDMSPTLFSSRMNTGNHQLKQISDLTKSVNRDWPLLSRVSRDNTMPWLRQWKDPELHF
ncbi:hypothetical protein ACHQM5_007671 [Ranunculus cassubicifolius]